ncbi:MAG TPA: hypothetical protein VJ654_06665 [Noviherbaspirillum sp.]|nr:hypothetical protein [Noviherbaspirillum sp.]
MKADGIPTDGTPIETRTSESSQQKISTERKDFRHLKSFATSMRQHQFERLHAGWAEKLNIGFCHEAERSWDSFVSPTYVC